MVSFVKVYMLMCCKYIYSFSCFRIFNESVLGVESPALGLYLSLLEEFAC